VKARRARGERDGDGDGDGDERRARGPPSLLQLLLSLASRVGPRCATAKGCGGALLLPVVHDRWMDRCGSSLVVGVGTTPRYSLCLQFH
jgi:hypothetical protein